MKPDDRIRLTHIAEALNQAVTFTAGRTRSDLDHDQMLTFALLQAIQIVGDAASHVSEATRGEYPDIRWPAMIGMRHRLVHGYADINLDILWSTATDAAPRLLIQVNRILASD